jgi:PAS domain S-box-containing protein
MTPTSPPTPPHHGEPFATNQRALLERIAAGAPLPELLEGIVRLVERQASGMFCSILLLDRERRHFRHGAAPSLPDAYNQAIDGLEIGPAVGSCGTAAYEGKRVVVADIATHPYWAKVKDLALPIGLRACWSTPIFSPAREVLGTFAMYYGEPREPLPQDIEWVDAATHLAAIAICRVAADQALHESEARYRLMVDTAYEGIWQVDMEARATFVNQRMAEMLGCPQEEILGRSMFEFMDEASRQIAREKLGRRWTGISEQYEFRFLRQDGTELWGIVAASPVRDETGQIIGALGMVTDITKRKAAEAALRRGEEELRAMFESTAMGVALVDTSGAIIKCNPALEQLMGYASGELIGVTIAQMTHPEDLDLENFRELIAGQRDTYRYEKRYLRKDRAIIWVRVTASARREADGRRRFVMGMIEDVTERHQAEEERARLETQLRQSQKMQSLGTLAGGVAHDFNNILTAISGNTQLALMDVPADHPARVSLAEIEAATNRAADLVRQILAFSRPQEPKRRVVNVQTVMEEALRLLRASLPATIEIRVSHETGTPDIAADATQIHQVIMNLGANAAHAVGDHAGLLEFQLAPVTVDASLAATSPELREGHYARLRVRDNGCGMDRATVERIFEPFFTTKKPGHGTGLGLSVVHGIVKGHGGAITVYSTRSQGTAFHVYLPAAGGTSSEPTAPTAASLRGQGERILYVDDEEQLIFLARRGLEKLGYKLTTFNDARQALEAFRAQPQEFDLIITDLAMPGLSGLDFTAEIRRISPEVPVLLTSGYLRPQDTETARRLGIRELLPKPASLEHLAQAIQRAVQSR